MQILLADDDKVLQKLLGGVLPSWGYEPIAAFDGDHAWKILQGARAPRIAIVDWVMPGVDWIGLCRLVRARQSADYVYLIVLTSRASRLDSVEAMEAGADDFIPKPFDLHELQARLRPARRIVELERQLAHRANYDELTGLPNRHLLTDRFTQLADIAKRRGEAIALLYLDMDDFKQVNDTYGHRQGDTLLERTAARLRGATRESDTLARVGGDEFVLLAGGVSAPRQIARLVEKLRNAVERPVVLVGGTVAPKISIGVSVYPVDGTDLDALQDRADTDMYDAKRMRKGMPSGEVSLLVSIER
jgi:diguanylate cyclase (GGDEF)-like protein